MQIFPTFAGNFEINTQMKNKEKLAPTSFTSSKVTTTISISLVLFLLGLVVFITLFAGRLSDNLKEKLSFDIVLQENTSEESIQQLQNQLQGMQFVKSIQYISKEEALLQLESDMGYIISEDLGENPLPDIIVINLKAEYAYPDSLTVIDNQLKSYSTGIIKDVEYHKEIMQKVADNVTTGGIILLVIATILLFISFALINNTIRLMMHSKRFLIHTMQLVGAKKSFIMQPFIRSHIIQGIIAAVLANIALYWLVNMASNAIQNSNLLGDTLSLVIVFGSVVVFGILIAVIATYSSVSKYIRADIGDLYTM